MLTSARSSLARALQPSTSSGPLAVVASGLATPGCAPTAPRWQSTSAAAPSSPSASTPSSSSTSATTPSAAPHRRSRDVPEATLRRISGLFYDPTITLSRRQRQVFARPEDEPALPAVREHGWLYGLTDADMEGRSEAVRRALSTRTGSQADLKAFLTAETVKRYQGEALDSGSSKVQVAVLTDRINRISSHLARNKHDTHSKRQLILLASRRRRVLQYMIRKDFHSYRVLLSPLGIRPLPLIGSRHPPKMRKESHKQINAKNKRLKNRTSRGDKGH